MFVDLTFRRLLMSVYATVLLAYIVFGFGGYQSTHAHANVHQAKLSVFLKTKKIITAKRPTTTADGGLITKKHKM